MKRVSFLVLFFCFPKYSLYLFFAQTLQILFQDSFENIFYVFRIMLLFFYVYDPWIWSSLSASTMYSLEFPLVPSFSPYPFWLHQFPHPIFKLTYFVFTLIRSIGETSHRAFYWIYFVVYCQHYRLIFFIITIFGPLLNFVLLSLFVFSVMSL